MTRYTRTGGEHGVFPMGIYVETLSGGEGARSVPLPLFGNMCRHLLVCVGGGGVPLLLFEGTYLKITLHLHKLA